MTEDQLNRGKKLYDAITKLSEKYSISKEKRKGACNLYNGC